MDTSQLMFINQTADVRTEQARHQPITGQYWGVWPIRGRCWCRRVEETISPYQSHHHHVPALPLHYTRITNAKPRELFSLKIPCPPDSAVASGKASNWAVSELDNNLCMRTWHDTHDMIWPGCRHPKHRLSGPRHHETQLTLHSSYWWGQTLASPGVAPALTNQMPGLRRMTNQRSAPLIPADCLTQATGQSKCYSKYIAGVTCNLLWLKHSHWRFYYNLQYIQYWTVQME